MRLIASGEHTANRRRRRRVLVLFLATLLVCWGAGPALASEGEEAGATDAVQPPDTIIDITQSSEDTTPISDAAGDIDSPSTDDAEVESGTTTGDSTEDAVDDASSDGETETTENSESPTVDSANPDAGPDSSTTTPSQDSGTGTVDLPADCGAVDQGNGAMDTSPDEVPDSDVADVGEGQDSGSTGCGSTGTEGSSTGTEDGSDSSEGSSSEETPQPDIEPTPDKDSSGDQLPAPSDSDDKEKSDESDKADEDETDVEEGTQPVDDAASDGIEEPDAEVIEDYVPTGTEVASNETEEADSPKDRNNEPSPRAVRSDLNSYGSAYTGVKSGRASSPWISNAEPEEPSLAHLVEAGNRIQGTASFELVAEERKGETKPSAQAIGKGFSLPFSNGFGMPLTGFDILVMSLMGLSLILVGVVLFARGLERQTAARRSTRRREELEAPAPASRESVSLPTRIRGLTRKRVV